MKTKDKCPDCGNAPVNHTLTWLSAAIEKSFEPISKPIDSIWKGIEPVVARPLYENVGPIIMKTLVAIKLSSFAEKPDKKTGGRARVMWEEAHKRGIHIREFRLFHTGREIFMANFKGEKITFIGLPRPGHKDSPSIHWMDNKDIVQKKFGHAGIPVPRGGVTSTWSGALKLFKKLGAPVIIKPEIGSRSRHTTTHIVDEAGLRIAFKKAQQLSPRIMVQEELAGFVYRATLIGGKVAAVLLREPPLVKGDGVHSIGELIEIENKNPLRDGAIFHHIEIGDGAKEELTRQKITLNSIPEKNMVVTLAQKASRGLGGGATDVTDEMHPDNREMLEHAGIVLRDSLVGIDLIISDITKSWKEQDRVGIIECNSMPFIDLHHFPLKGKVRNVAGMLWDLNFPESGKFKETQEAQ